MVWSATEYLSDGEWKEKLFGVPRRADPADDARLALSLKIQRVNQSLATELQDDGVVPMLTKGQSVDGTKGNG